jgi:hypothetical protein
VPSLNHVLLVIRNEDEVFLHADVAGLDFLIERLRWIRKKVSEGVPEEHEHLMTESWGGDELTESIGSERSDTTLVHHVKIFGWSKEWAMKHGFKR